MSEEKKILSQFVDQIQLRAFFSSPENERFFYLTYPEYCQVFGFQSDESYLPEINKRIIYGHLDFFNQCYDSLWVYKWTPLILKFMLNTVRLRPTSFIFSGLYLVAFDFFLEQFAIFKALDKRNIKIVELLNFELNKPKYQTIRQKQLKSYIDIINQDGDSMREPDPDEKTDAILAGTPRRKLLEYLNKEAAFRVSHNFFLELVRYLKHLDYSSLGEKIQSYTKNFYLDFFEYKTEFKRLPSRKDFEALLRSPLIKDPKVRGAIHDFQDKIDDLIFGIGYHLDPKAPEKLWKFDWTRIKKEEQEKMRFLQLKNNWADLAIFSLFVILPSKLLRFARRK